MCELRYFREILMISSDPYLLFDEKCKMIVNDSVQYPDYLQVFFDGFPWLFDYSPTKRKAAGRLASVLLPPFELARCKNA